MKNQKGFAHAFLVIGLVVALAGALGFIFWQNFIHKEPVAKNDSVVATKKVDSDKKDTSDTPVVKEGTISGSLTYPSEGIPEDLVVYALNLDTNKEYYTKEHITDAHYQYGTGYKVSVPEGRYYVYGIVASSPQSKAYYDEFVRCGMNVNCSDTSKVEVKVEADKETTNVMVGDWYNNQ